MKETSQNGAVAAAVPPDPDAGRGKAVHLDFSGKGAPTEQAGSPFRKAKTQEKRLKLFLWGDYGTGKTTLALQFPKPVVIDMERGSDLYGDDFDFEVLHATTADEVMAAVEWLLKSRHEHRTLVIDPITVYWDALQRKWSDIFLKRNKGSKGYKFEFYDLQPRDWMTVKAEFKEFIRKLVALDMNVIVTARQKALYDQGALMKVIGETFDGERSLPYLFDTIVRMSRDEKGRFMGACLKDRSNRLPKEPFECSYGLFEGLFGKKALARKAKPVEPASEEQKRRIRELVEKFAMTPEQVSKRLAAYGAQCLDDLSDENALLILSKFETALAAKAGAQSKAKTQTQGKE